MEMNESQRIANYRMPEAKQGMQVAFYPWGTKDGRDPHLGFVLKVSGLNIVVRSGDGSIREAVRHITDPRLLLSAEQRENGAWDYTDEYHSDLEFRKSIRDRLSKLEKKIDAMKASSRSS